MPASPAPLVAKFGGTSVATPERIRRVVEIVRASGADLEAGARRVVVVSALGGVTDDLIAALDAAEARAGTHRETLDALRQRHEAALTDLAPEAEQDAVRAVLDARFADLRDLLDGVALLREVSPRTRDAVIGTGERLSAPIVAAAFRASGADAVALDAAELIRTDDTFGQAVVDVETSDRLIHEAIGKGERCVVELLNYTRAGKPFWNRLSIVPVPGDDGKPTHFVGIQSDVTALREAEGVTFPSEASRTGRPAQEGAELVRA